MKCKITQLKIRLSYRKISRFHDFHEKFIILWGMSVYKNADQVGTILFMYQFICVSVLCSSIDFSTWAERSICNQVMKSRMHQTILALQIPSSIDTSFLCNALYGQTFGLSLNDVLGEEFYTRRNLVGSKLFCAWDFPIFRRVCDAINIVYLNVDLLQIEIWHEYKSLNS